MPQDERWVRACRKLYGTLSKEDRDLIDSYRDDCPDLNRRDRETRLRRIAQQLMIKAGYESEYTILPLPEKRKENTI